MPYPRFQRARNLKFINYSQGNLSLGSITVAPVESSGTGALDIIVDAQTGDVLAVSFNAKVRNEANGIYFTAATMVNGSAVRSIHGGNLANYSQVPSWYVPASVFGSVGSTWLYVVTSGDVGTNKTVTLRPFYTTDAATPLRVVDATAAIPLQFSVRNLGPAETT